LKRLCQGRFPGSSYNNKGIGQKQESQKETDHYDNIKMHLREIEWGRIDWIDLPQDRNQWRALANKVMNLWGP
jgi:hypothetical protein